MHCGQLIAEQNPTKLERSVRIGQNIFLDTNLSEPRGQGCISCHRPEHAFADPRPASSGAVQTRKGNRNSPSLMYAALVPPFAFDEFFTPDGEEVYAYEGGLFWDGRSRDIFEQVQQPFYDSNEMNLKNESQLAARIRTSAYAKEFRDWIGDSRWKNDKELAYHSYLALVDFLQSPMFRPFDAKIDDFLDGQPNALNEIESRGLALYTGKANCSGCHPLNSNHWEQPLLSDFGYDNLGVPSVGTADPGLGNHTGNPGEVGQFRSPSLRNVALTAPYMHNGSIKSLREVVDFYNTRDTNRKRWTKTDFPKTVNRDDLGDLKLSDSEIDEIVAFLHCFTDRNLKQINKKSVFPEAPPGTPTSESKKLFFPVWTHRLHPCYQGSTIFPEDKTE